MEGVIWHAKWWNYTKIVVNFGMLCYKCLYQGVGWEATIHILIKKGYSCWWFLIDWWIYPFIEGLNSLRTIPGMSVILYVSHNLSFHSNLMVFDVIVIIKLINKPTNKSNNCFLDGRKLNMKWAIRQSSQVIGIYRQSLDTYLISCDVGLLVLCHVLVLLSMSTFSISFCSWDWSQFIVVVWVRCL